MHKHDMTKCVQSRPPCWMLKSSKNLRGRPSLLLTIAISLVMMLQSPPTAQAWPLDDDELTEPRLTITGILGGRVDLPCNIQPNSSDDEVSLVLWYKDDSTTPIYSLDSRKTTLRNAHHSPAHWLAGRAYLQAIPGSYSVPAHERSATPQLGRPRGKMATNAGDLRSSSSGWSAYSPSVLQLDPLEMEDEALYRCRVDFKRARTRNYEVQLVVVVPPTRLIVTDHRGTLLADKTVIGPYNEGEKLILKCQVHGGNPAPVAVWHRGTASSLGQPQPSNRSPTEHAPNLSYPRLQFRDIRLDGLVAVVNSSRESPSGSALTVTTTNDGSTIELIIHTLSRSDLLSAFACVASNNNISKPLVSTVVIDVYFRPRRVWISTLDSSASSPIVGDGGSSLILSAGVEVALQCSSSGSRPPAVIHWFKGGEIMNDTDSVLVHPTAPAPMGTVTKRLDEQAESLMRQHPQQNSQDAQHVTSHSSALLPADEHWLSSNSTIRFSPASDDDGKQLVCRAENPAMPNHSQFRIKVADKSQATSSSPSSDSRVIDTVENTAPGPRPSGNAIVDGVKLRVRYVPQLTVRLGKKLRHTHIREGNDVFLECDVKANPPLIEMGWRFEGQELTPASNVNSDGGTGRNKHKGIVISEHTLVLQNVTRQSRGRYTCTGTNSVGQGESPPLVLRVKYEPRCKPGQRQIYGAAKNEEVQLSCELESDPEEVTFRWKARNSKGVVSFAPTPAPTGSTNGLFGGIQPHLGHNANPDRHGMVTSNGTRSWLTLVPRSEEDYGTVICLGYNPMGLQKEPCVFSLVPAGPPGPVHNCSIAKTSEDSITIACVEGYDGGAENGQQFHMEVHDSANQNRVLIANVTSTGNPPRPILTADGLSPSTAYVCTVYAANERGTSQPTILVASTIPRPLSLSKSSNNGYSFLLGYLDGGASNGSSSPSPLALFGLIAVVVIAAVAGLAFVVLLTLKAARSGQMTGVSRSEKSSKKAPADSISKEDDESAFPLRDSKKDADYITDLKMLSGSGFDDDNDGKCPDLIPDSLQLMSPSCSSTGGLAESSLITSNTSLSPFGPPASTTGFAIPLQQISRQTFSVAPVKTPNLLTGSLRSPEEWAAVAAENTDLNMLGTQHLTAGDEVSPSQVHGCSGLPNVSWDQQPQSSGGSFPSSAPYQRVKTITAASAVQQQKYTHEQFRRSNEETPHVVPHQRMYNNDMIPGGTNIDFDVRVPQPRYNSDRWSEESAPIPVNALLPQQRPSHDGGSQCSYEQNPSLSTLPTANTAGVTGGELTSSSRVKLNRDFSEGQAFAASSRLQCGPSQTSPTNNPAKEHDFHEASHQMNSSAAK